MIFNSFQFLWLFPIVFVCYYLILGFTGKKNSKVANIALLLMSYALYAQWNIWSVFVLFGITAISYLTAIAIENKKYVNFKKGILTAGVILTLTPLFIFKYYLFVYQIVGMGGGNSLISSLIAPLGISFYTFQALGYVWDVYYKKIEAERDWWSYMLFVAFFPQIISGPISKAQSLIPQIKSVRSFDYGKAVEGLRMLLWGMVLKTVMADRLGLYVDTVYSQYEYYSGSTLLLTSICYSLQIYGDFAGYSLMAIGVGKLLGFDLPENFRRPYFAVSVTQFWRRWHMSLTKWLTDYVYIPLGGSRCSKLKCNSNILATFLVSGIWHGANWTFIFWGFIHGVAQIVEKTVGLSKRECKNRLEVWLRIFITFMVVNLAWIFFRMPSIKDAWNVIIKIFTNLGGSLYIDKTAFFYMGMAIFIVAIKDIADEFFEDRHMILDSRYKAVRWLGYTALVMLLLLCGVFDAGQFIYANF